MTKLKGLLAAAAAFALVACGHSKDQGAAGALDIAVTGPGSTAAAVSRLVTGNGQALSQIQSVWVSIDSEALNYHEVTRVSSGAPQFPVRAPRVTGLLAGAYTVTATAYDDVDGRGNKLFEGSADATVTPRQVSAVSVVMRELVDPGSVDVRAPHVTGIAIGGTYPPVIGQPTSLTATVTGGEGTLTYAWTGTCGATAIPAAAFSAAAAKSTNLTLPACEQDATITFTVTASAAEGAGATYTASASIVLPYVPQGSEATITIDVKPTVEYLRATTNAQPLPGGQVSFTAHAVDPDGGAVTYAWSAKCGDDEAPSFSALDGGTTTWTAPDEAGPCTITLAATDDEDNTTKATFELEVGNPILTLAPYVDVCNSTTWECAPVASHPGASSVVGAAGLRLAKTQADGGGAAFGPNAHVLGVTGMTLVSASFDAVGTVGGGSPRFRVYTASGACTLELVDATVSGTTYTFHPTATCGGVLTGLDIVADMAGNLGQVDLTNIRVNGIAVTLPATGALIDFSSGSGDLAGAPFTIADGVATVSNIPDEYQTGYGSSVYSFFGADGAVYRGDFFQAVDVLVDTAWAPPAAAYDAAFWIDMTPEHADPNNYGAEHNFHLTPAGGSVRVTVDGASEEVTTLTESGWYTFLMTFEKAALPTDPVVTRMIVLDAAKNVLGSKTVTALSPGGPFLSQDLLGSGYVWFTLWQNGFAGDSLRIDNLRTGLLPF